MIRLRERIARILQKKRKNQELWFLIGILLIFLYYSPIIILKDNAVFIIHDALEVDIPYFKLNSQLITSTNILIPELFNGALRGAIQTSSFLTVVLFAILEPVTAYIASIILISIFAFCGVFLLLNLFFENNNRWISFGISFLYAVMPFYPNQGLSAMGIPFVLWAIHSLCEAKADRKAWIAIFLYGLSSSLVYSGYIIIIYLCIVFLYLNYKKRYNRNIFLAGTILCICYLTTHYYTFFSLFKQTSHRVDWRLEPITARWGIKDILSQNSYHFPSNQESFVVPVLIITGIGILLFTRLNRYQKKLVKYLCACIVLSMCIGIFENIYNGEAGVELRNHLNILKSFQSRLYVLYPTIWFTIYAITLQLLFSILASLLHLKRIMVNIIIGICVLRIADINYKYNSCYQANVRSLIGEEVNQCSWKEYYDEELYARIRNYIGVSQSSYRVVNIGISPGVALYNGFYCLDGYSVNYSAEYKRFFRKIIEKELDKDEVCKEYFDLWGSRCYMFVAELGKDGTDVLKNDKFVDTGLALNDLEINGLQLKKMGGRYVMSAYEILNAGSSHLCLKNVFRSELTDLLIYLYEVQY
ncbi:MAG: hypothetical protein HFI21_17075 [Lachnospiraceae bacterium]|uniref:DUF6044 family protein n=1 Tax=Candidatus Merdisoma sp. JLR.KK011 TaxID=3114299 RepID=UPI002FF17EDA|nr:hypothetical protein [Lachnospiraceae bacterium]